MPPKKSHEQFVSELAERQPTITVLGLYQGAQKKLDVECAVCGHKWQAIASNLSRGVGCPSCAGNARKTSEQFVAELQKINPLIEVVGSYQSRKTPLLVKCKQCGREWESIPNNLLEGKGCAACAGVMRGSVEELRGKIEGLGLPLEVLGEYVNNVTPIECRCSLCGGLWKAKPAHLLRGHACPSCGRKKQSEGRRRTTEDFKSELRVVNPDLMLESEYRGRHEKVDVKCARCGHAWSAEAGSLLCGTGCPSCATTSTSFAEQLIRGAFSAVLGGDNVLSRDRSAIGVELDIYLPAHALAIEIGSWFWHKNKTEGDAAKRAKCLASGIRLITIYDSFDGKIPFEEDCYTFENDLGKKKSFDELKKLIVSDLLPLVVSGESDLALNWGEIEDLARSNAKRKSTDEFVEQLRGVSPNVTVCGKYTRDDQRIAVKCGTCGYEWSPHAGSLLQGHGCPKCAKRRRRTQAEFVSEVAEVSPSLCIVGRFTTTKNRILTRCRRCGHEWNPQAGNLLRGHGCPKCSVKEVSRKLKKR